MKCTQHKTHNKKFTTSFLAREMKSLLVLTREVKYGSRVYWINSVPTTAGWTSVPVTADWMAA